MIDSGEVGTGYRRRRLISGIRVAQAAVAVSILASFSLLAGLNPLVEWWFWTAAVTAITAAIAEPYYTGPVAALLYAVAGVAAGLTAKRDGVEVLWYLHFGLAAAVGVAALLALLLHSGRAAESAKWVATRFGRPAWLGLSAVAIELMRGVGDRTLPVTALTALGVVLAMVLALPDWYKLVVATRAGVAEFTNVVAAIEPNLLLLATDTRLSAGDRVRVRGRREVGGVVIGNLAHKSGNRVQIALDSPWNMVVGAAGDLVDVLPEAFDNKRPLGLAGEGSTDRSLDLRSFGELRRGDTIYWEDARTNKKYLYQVLGLDLRQSLWDGAAVISEHARAGLLGTVEPSGVVPDTRLPAPFASVFSAASVTTDLPEGYTRIGSILGTAVPIGVEVNRLRGHHLAILGMSGMGKSTIARKVLQLLGGGATSVAIDATGEYLSRYGISAWDATSGLTTDGESVFEPTPGSGADKSLAGQARDFIKAAMNAAAGEYKIGVPRHRSILIEEAHSFLPEWNFVTIKGESDIVAESCRMILQSRKYALNFVLVSQRTAVISKSAISQCESYIIFRTLDETSLQYVEAVVGSEYRELASSLDRYQAICVGPAFSTNVPVVVQLDPVT